MFGKILVCLDGSTFAERILPYASSEALKFKSEITLLSVVTTDIPMYALPSVEAVRFVPYDLFACEIAERETRMQSYLRDLAQGLKGTGLNVECVTIQGRMADIGQIIADYAVANGFNLIAMATRGYKGLRRLLLGSVTGSVTRKSSLPVLSIKPRVPEPDDEVLNGTADLSLSAN